MYSYALEYIIQHIYAYVGIFSYGCQVQKCSQKLDHVQIHVYFRSKYTFTEISMLGKWCLKYLSTVCKMKRKGIFVRRSSSNHRSGLQEAPQFATTWACSCPAATRYMLTPQQSVPTTACSAVVRESQCGQVCQFLGAYNRSSHVGCLAVVGSLTYHTVWSQSDRSSTRVMRIARTSMSVLLGARARPGVCAGVRSFGAAVLWFILFGIVWCIMQCCAAAQYVCSSPHPAYLLCHRSPASRGFDKLSGSELDFFFLI